MTNIPRFCNFCSKVYWEDPLLHICNPVKQKGIEKTKQPPLKNIHKCQNCEQIFTSGHKVRKYCSKYCRDKYEYRNKIVESNHKWINDQPKKPRKKPKYSIDDLDRLDHWKRMRDNNSWMKKYKCVRG